MKVLKFLFGPYCRMWTKMPDTSDRATLWDFWGAVIPAFTLEISALLIQYWIWEPEVLHYILLAIALAIVFAQFFPIAILIGRRWADIVPAGRKRPELADRLLLAFLYKKSYPGRNCYGPDPTNPDPTEEDFEESEYFHRLSGKPGHSKSYVHEHGGWVCEGCGSENYRYVCPKCGMNQSESDALEWKKFINNRK